ncbi:C40 family peptidase [Lysinibacillus piscis]|uniref:Peptidoglycan endopeptidase LytE n=1 Tax=Lysinibacillus piscis TaxID=2518931 RepID=A0ABQ5NHS3_9BACI|nr:C40 family peptidase [Lysinibacillus sp. KH24]GLC87848.1 putative peptidoglycan endopeptidase LytE [Lysinibacillus sp. KH24]
MKISKKLSAVTLGIVSTIFLTIPTAEAATYVVQKGDTLTKVAQRHQVSIQDIKAWNNLVEDTIFVAQKLDILTPAKPIVVSHTVAKGDTLSNIAKQYNVALKDIKEWNKLQKDTIYIGQVLAVSPVALIPEEESVHKVVTPSPSTDTTILVNAPTTNSQTIYKKAIELANTLVGIPYVFGGNTVEGLDCSGLIFYTFNQSGLKIARDSSEGYYFGSTVQVKNPVAGDLVFFENTYKEGISHMGIYLGGTKFVHAGTNGVEVSDVTNSYWSTRLVGYKRFDIIK